MNKFAILVMFAVNILPSLTVKAGLREPKPNPSWLILQSLEMPADEYPTLKVWGLVNAVYSFDETEKLVPDNTISLRRGYLGVRGAWMKDIDYFFLADFGTGVVGRTTPLLLDASITLKHVPYLKIRFGQFKIPFGLEGLEAHHTPPLINFTRASVQLLSISAPLGTSDRAATNSAFRDLGVQFFNQIGQEKEIQLVYALAMFNGNGINTIDNNNQKDLVGRLEIASKGLRFGLSGLTGKETTNELRKRRLGVDATYNLRDLHLGGEVIWGQDNLVVGGLRTARGWYLRASYLLRQRFQPVLRYEQFDPNNKVSVDRFEAVAVGFNWIFKGYTRLQVNYEFRNDQANPRTGNLLTVQAQIFFEKAV